MTTKPILTDNNGLPILVYHGGERFTHFTNSQPEFRVVEFASQPGVWRVQEKYGPNPNDWTQRGPTYTKKIEAETQLDKYSKINGIYFTDDLDVAASYAGQYPKECAEIKTCHIRTANPLDLRNPKTFAKWIGPIPDQFFCEKTNMAHCSNARNGGILLDKAQAAGFDAIIFYDTDVYDKGCNTSYVVFDANQISPTQPPHNQWWGYPMPNYTK